MQWSGPSTVIGQEGKIIFLKYGNKIRRVHMSRVIRVGNEYNQNEVKDDVKMTEGETTNNKEETDEKTWVGAPRTQPGRTSNPRVPNNGDKASKNQK